MATQRRTQAERSEATREAILTTARRLFAAPGVAATSIEQVLEGAGLTRGALYHHFSSKTDVFLAVFDAVEADITAGLAKAARLHDAPWDRLVAGTRAFLQSCLDPEVRRIVLLDAHAVLTPDQVQAVKASHSQALLRLGLENAAKAGDIAPDALDMTAELLLGAIAACAVAIGRAADPVAAEAEAWTAYQRVLEGLRRR